MILSIIEALEASCPLRLPGEHGVSRITADAGCVDVFTVFDRLPEFIRFRQIPYFFKRILMKVAEDRTIGEAAHRYIALAVEQLLGDSRDLCDIGPVRIVLASLRKLS